jgi:CRISPR-associated protein Csd1
LSGNSARAIIRDYLEAPLPQVQANLGRWFHDLTIAAATNDGAGQPTNLFPLWQLVVATALEMDQVASNLPSRLIHAALMGGPVPDSVLAACLGRLRAEGKDGFRLPRMALIKLCLNRTHCKGEQTMPESLDKQRTQDAAYVYGRLLAFLARCQNPKDFGTSAQILERFYGTASVSPRSVFPTLLRLNRHHLAKIRDENKGFAFNLEAELDEILDQLRPSNGTGPQFKPILSLPEQGQFALGFYQQRAAYRRQSADQKVKEASEAIQP